MHKSLVELEFLPDPTTDYEVSCSCASSRVHVHNLHSYANKLCSYTPRFD